MKINRVMVFLGLALFSACGKELELSREEQLRGELNTMKSAGDLAYQLFGGSYKADCQWVQIGGATIYLRDQITFVAGIDRARGNQSPAYRESTVVYSDPSCTEPFAEEVQSGDDDFQMSGVRLILSPTAYEITPRSALAARAMNEQSACGKTDWKVGTTVDITKLACFSSYRKQYNYLNWVNADGTEIEIYYCESESALPSECKKVRYKI